MPPPLIQNTERLLAHLGYETQPEYLLKAPPNPPFQFPFPNSALLSVLNDSETPRFSLASPTQLKTTEPRTRHAIPPFEFRELPYGLGGLNVVGGDVYVAIRDALVAVVKALREVDVEVPGGASRTMCVEKPELGRNIQVYVQTKRVRLMLWGEKDVVAVSGRVEKLGEGEGEGENDVLVWCGKVTSVRWRWLRCEFRWAVDLKHEGKAEHRGRVHGFFTKLGRKRKQKEVEVDDEKMCLLD